MFCNACGKKNSRSAKFCNSCGSSIVHGTPGASSSTAGAKGNTALAVPDDSALQIPDGIILQERFKIEKLIATGGMGRIYRAFDLNFGENIVIKEMLINSLNLKQAKAAVNKFKKEAKVLFNLKHSKIPKVFDFFTIDRRCFIAMEFIEGETLEEFVRRQSAGCSEDDVIDFALQIGEILQYLHSQKPPIIFRDLKPLNIIVAPDKKLNLIDFGIAKELNRATGTSIGTQGYACPEQYRGHCDPRSDLYALGGIIHFCLTRRNPEDDAPFTFHKHKIKDYRTIEHDWQPIVDKLTAYEPAKRFDAVSSFIENLNLSCKKERTDAESGKGSRGAQKTGTITGPVNNTPLNKNKQGFYEILNKADGSELVEIPAGEFTMGSEEHKNEAPMHKVFLKNYYIGKHQVANEQFAQFVKDTGYTAEGEWQKSATPTRLKHPVVHITWNDAMAYCKWAGVRLPTEAEWEKAARGLDKREFPWGNKWEPEYLNWSDPVNKDKHRARGAASSVVFTESVNSFPEGCSYYGVMNMAGNVWEWCSTLYRSYPYSISDGRENPGSNGERILRGGSWDYDDEDYFRCAYRFWNEPAAGTDSCGFRVAISSEPR